MFDKLPGTDPLGTDLALDENGDLQVAMYGSVATVDQQENVAQAVRISLMTIPYTYLWGDQVGSRLAEWIDQPLTENLVRNVQTIVLEHLQSDPRILNVQEVRVEQPQPDALLITVRALVSTIGVVEIPILAGR